MNFLQATTYGHPSVVLSGLPSDGNFSVWPATASINAAAVNPGPRNGKRRVTANKKERRRTLSLNNAYAELRDRIPNVPADTKLSKIKTLRLAASYITYLMELLAEGEDGIMTPEQFKAAEVVAAPQPQPTLTIMNPPKKQKTSGRTGWPQYVWALELKQENPS